MNINAIKELVKVIRLDWKVFYNPFKYVLEAIEHGHVYDRGLESAGLKTRVLSQLNAIEMNHGAAFGRRHLEDLAIAYDAWLDLWPDSWDADLFPGVLDLFVDHFAVAVEKVLAIGRLSTALQVANLVREFPTGSWSHDTDAPLCVSDAVLWFSGLADELKAEHEQALNELENNEINEQLLAHREAAT